MLAQATYACATITKVSLKNLCCPGLSLQQLCINWKNRKKGTGLLYHHQLRSGNGIIAGNGICSAEVRTSACYKTFTGCPLCDHPGSLGESRACLCHPKFPYQTLYHTFTYLSTLSLATWCPYWFIYLFALYFSLDEAVNSLSSPSFISLSMLPTQPSLFKYRESWPFRCMDSLMLPASFL